MFLKIAHVFTELQIQSGKTFKSLATGLWDPTIYFSSFLDFYLSVASGAHTEASIIICFLWSLQRQTQEFNYPQVRMNKYEVTFFKVDKATWASDF